jgi:hypothetical protein
MNNPITLDGITFNRTPELIQSIGDAIVEIRRQIDKEMGYSEDLRNQEYLDRKRARLAKLEEALKGCTAG